MVQDSFDEMGRKLKDNFFPKNAYDSHKWQEIMRRVTRENKKTLETFMTHTSFEEIQKNFQKPLTIFDPEIVTGAYQKAIQGIMQNPDKTQEVHFNYVQSLQEVWTKAWEDMPTQLNKEKKKRGDRRFQAKEWDEYPFFNLMKNMYDLNSNYANAVVDSIDGLDSSTKQKLKFYSRQMTDAFSPTNFPMTNPEVWKTTVESKGENFIKGFQNLMQDVVDGKGLIKMTDMSAFKIGEDIATTPGKVVYQNDLFQLIQYEPKTKTVAKRPLLIVPPWINKFYVFDLKPENSFIKWAVESGQTVFVMSWVNPDGRYKNKTLSDYVMEGAKTALDQVCEITKEKEVNAVGYCTGGIALSCLMSVMADRKDRRIKSSTVIASPIDFSQAGDLLVYVCEKQLDKLQNYVDQRGYLEGEAMVASFNLLRSNDLIWSFYVNNYLLGKDPIPFDMLHWNCDAMRMPAKMHMNYLRAMYMDNKLIKPNGLTIDGLGVDLAKVKTPTFVMAAIDDHIAPWKSVYPVANLFQGKNKFVLSGSGHVAGVFNSLNKNKYHYWTSDSETLPSDADGWLNKASQHTGSWWSEWREWVRDYEGKQVPARQISKKRIIEDAPGSYVKMK